MKAGHKRFPPVAALAAFLLLVPAALAQVSRGKPKDAAASVKELAVPYRAGETLNYRVAWTAFANAATVQLSVPEKRDFFGWRTWHLRALAHTLNPARALFAIDDQFDSYTDATTLESRQYEMYLNEMGEKEQHVLHFVPAGKTSRAPGPSVVVLPDTRDPLGALYALRSVDWQRTPELRVPVCDGRDIYEMDAKLEAASEQVTVDAGSFSASRISIRVSRNGKEVMGVRFTVWLANNATRTPVQMQAELPFGNVRIGLTSASQ